MDRKPECRGLGGRGACRLLAGAAMDPFRVLLHSVSADLSSGELTELKFLCQGLVGKRKLERVQRGHELFEVLLEQKDLEAEHTGLLRDLLASLRRHDLLQRLDDFEAGAAAGAAQEAAGERGGPAAGAGPVRPSVDSKSLGSCSLPGVLGTTLGQEWQMGKPKPREVNPPEVAGPRCPPLACSVFPTPTFSR